MYSEDKNIYTSQDIPQAAAKPTVLEPIGPSLELTDRGISKATAEKYKVFLPKNSFDKYGFPLFRDGVHIGNKYRRAGDIKGFGIQGDIAKAELFGQHLFPPGSAKTITVTEGYEDAMAAYEMNGSRYPSVSVHSASSARKDCAQNFEYLNSFESIVLCFDADEGHVQPDGTTRYPGQEAAVEVAKLFPLGKVRVVTFKRHKDANDYLKAGMRKEFLEEWWAGPTFKPDGIRLGTDLWEEIRESSKTESVPYPWEGFNQMTYGLRLGEFVVLTADTGSGKTSVMKEIEYYLLNTVSKYGLGILHLEETNKDTGLGIMALEANKPLHLPDVRDKVSEAELKQYYDKTINNERVIIYDHFGSNDIDDLLNKVRYMAAMGAKFIFLDHLSIIVSDQRADERKQLDEVSTKLKTLCMELMVCVIAVVHQNRRGEIRGTAGVEQLANIVIKMTREKEADDPWRRNILKCVIQKNRFCGRTGPAAWLEYVTDTGRLIELDKVGIDKYESGKSLEPSFAEEW